jgi:hypothetical protein
MDKSQTFILIFDLNIVTETQWISWSQYCLQQLHNFMTVNNKFRKSFIFWVYLFPMVVIYLEEHN